MLQRSFFIYLHIFYEHTHTQLNFFYMQLHIHMCILLGVGACPQIRVIYLHSHLFIASALIYLHFIVF